MSFKRTLGIIIHVWPGSDLIIALARSLEPTKLPDPAVVEEQTTG